MGLEGMNGQMAAAAARRAAAEARRAEQARIERERQEQAKQAANAQKTQQVEQKKTIAATNKATQKQHQGPSPTLGLKKGDKGVRVTKLQKQLNAHNTSSLNKDIRGDGSFGKATVQAVKRFQKSRGIKATGEIDIATATALDSVPMTKQEIKQYQAILNKKSVAGDTKLKSDGVIGPKTHQQIKNFQKSHNLKQTGALDSLTIETLKSSYRSQGAEKAIGKMGIKFDEQGQINDLEKFGTISAAAFSTAKSPDALLQAQFTKDVKGAKECSANQQPSLNPSQISERSAALYESMHGGVAGWGTNKDQLFAAMADLNANDAQLVHADYNNRYPGKDLIKDFNSELSGAELDYVKAQFSGDQLTADIAGIKAASEGIGTNENLLFKVLEKNSGNMQKFKAEFKKQSIADLGNGASVSLELESYVDGELDGADFDRAQALMSGNVPKADAIALHQALDGGGTNEAVVDRILKKYINTEGTAQSQLEIEYTKMNGKGSLKADLESDYTFADEDRVLAMAGFQTSGIHLAQDRLSSGERIVNMKIAELDQAFDYGVFATDEDKIREVFAGTTAEQRRDIIKGYNTSHSESLTTKFTSELSALEFAEMDAMASNGQLSPIQSVFYAMKNGEIKDSIATLKTMSKPQIDTMRSEWKKAGAGDMDTILLAHATGIDNYDMQEALKGNLSELAPAYRATLLMDRANARAELVKSDLGYAFINALGSSRGKVMEANLDRMNAAYAMFVGTEGEVTKTSAALLETMANFTTQDARKVRGAKAEGVQEKFMQYDIANSSAGRRKF